MDTEKNFKTQDMPENYKKLANVQQLVLDILKVERNHQIPGAERSENVVEHSFGVAMLSWRLHDALGLNLSIDKILKYSLVHDFSEHGLRRDINSFASPQQRAEKSEYEAKTLNKIITEFADFKDFTKTLQDYQKREDEESLFVWSVDKIQAIILGEIDDWRPYISANVSYEGYCTKGKEWLDQCSPYLKEVLAEVIEQGRQTYYDQPN